MERRKGPSCDGRPFYRIVENDDGLVDVWLSPGEAVYLTDTLTGLMDYNIRALAVTGIDPKDPQWGGDLEEHVRRNYSAWCESAKIVEF